MGINPGLWTAQVWHAHGNMESNMNMSMRQGDRSRALLAVGVFFQLLVVAPFVILSFLSSNQVWFLVSALVLFGLGLYLSWTWRMSRPWFALVFAAVWALLVSLVSLMVCNSVGILWVHTCVS